MKKLHFLYLAILLVTSSVFADVKISDLPSFPEGGWISSDVFPVVDVANSATKKTSVGDFDLRYIQINAVTAPIVYSVGNLGCRTATNSLSGCLAPADFSAFSNKAPAFSVTSPLTYVSNVIAMPAATSSVNGYLTSTDWTTFNGKQAAGSYITALTSDVSASGPGSATATVNSIGGSSASNVHSAELAANAATNTNTVSTIVKRDSSGNFSAGTITAALTGHASADEPAITAGTSAQYWRGDKTFQTLNTTAVPEGSNLYYLDSRVQTLAKNQISAQELWVAKDVGNDANDGSRLKPYQTIGAAITAANAVAAYYKQVIIHIQPINNGGSVGGAYNENITLSQQGVNLVCDQPGAYSRPCVVTGTLTVNLTGVSGGTNFIAGSNEVYIDGLVFTSGASNTVTFSGTVFQKLIAKNCYFQAGAAHSAVVTNTGTNSEFRSYDTTFENNSSTLETVTLTAGRFWLYGMTGTVMNDNASGPSVLQNGASSMIGNFTQFTGQYQQTNNTATATFNLSTITAGTNSCVSTPATPSTGYALFAYAGCNSSNANAITGSGVAVYATGNACLGTACSAASTVVTSSLGKLPEGTTFLHWTADGFSALSTNQMVGYGKTTRALLIENFVATAGTFTCSVNPQFTLYDCGTSAGACTTGRTALANITLTAANTGTNGTVTSPTLAAGHYWAVEVSAGTCSQLSTDGNAEAAQQ